jgi:hypothetical protein
MICNVRDGIGSLGRMYEKKFKNRLKYVVELNDGTDHLDIEDILTVTFKK